MDDSIETRIYYTLRYQRTDAFHKKGECVASLAGELYIGQSVYSDVRLENSSLYEDESLALIKAGHIAGEWMLMPMSETIKTFVNGVEVSLVHYLKDGDLISFENETQELLFRVNNDGKFTTDGIIMQMTAQPSRWLLSLLVVILFVLFLLLGIYVYTLNNKENEIQSRLDSVKESVLRISVDSVILMRITPDGEEEINRYSYIKEEGHAITGTAFITDDLRLITARHCIEPWLADDSVYKLNTLSDLKSLPTRWALEAETYNQLHDNDTTYRVVAVCNFYRGTFGTEQYGKAVRSTVFRYDNSRDNIVEIGDFNTVYYWRSVKETYSNKDMMLGDIAWMRTDSVGKITLLPGQQLPSLIKEQQRLYFMGYPEYKTSSFETVDGKVRLGYMSGSMIVHSGKLIRGYSGGPALMFNDGKVYAVGVISRIDGSGGERMYSVPVNELAKGGGRK